MALANALTEQEVAAEADMDQHLGGELWLKPPSTVKIIISTSNLAINATGKTQVHMCSNWPADVTIPDIYTWQAVDWVKVLVFHCLLWNLGQITCSLYLITEASHTLVCTTTLSINPTFVKKKKCSHPQPAQGALRVTGRCLLLQLAIRLRGQSDKTATGYQTWVPVVVMACSDWGCTLQIWPHISLCK